MLEVIIGFKSGSCIRVYCKDCTVEYSEITTKVTAVHFVGCENSCVNYIDLDSIDYVVSYPKQEVSVPYV